MIDFKSLGLRIKQSRRIQNLTQDKLAEMTGLSKSFIGCIENNTSIPSVESSVKISEALGVTPVYFVVGIPKDRDCPQRIFDKVQLCSPQDQEYVELLVDAIIEKRQIRVQK